jgi:hypothetical protein
MGVVALDFCGASELGHGETLFLMRESDSVKSGQGRITHTMRGWKGNVYVSLVESKSKNRKKKD